VDAKDERAIWAVRAGGGVQCIGRAAQGEEREDKEGGDAGDHGESMGLK
jgi:hypothetical protein